ncbi:MAG: hypothetical protein U0M23_04035 [Acutalibacteraceae bacterium]|nr:hypothetical protein [Acutalibacteraceae bacterium]
MLPFEKNDDISIFNRKGRQQALLSPLSYPSAKPGGTVNGGAVCAVYLAASWLVGFCCIELK